MNTHQRDERQPDDRAGRGRRPSRPLAVTLLAVPVVATAGAFGIPALAASAPAQVRLTSTAPVAEHARDAGRDAPAPSAVAEPGAGAEPSAVGKPGAVGNPGAVGKPRAAGKPRALGKPGAVAEPAPAPAGRAGDDAALDAYFGAGHDYDDAVRLAKLWHAAAPGGDLSRVKIAAGRNLLAGRPFTAPPKDLPTAQAMLAAYAHAGYDADDAVLLARLWGQGMTPAQAKEFAGEKILAGQLPPLRPGQTAATASTDAALEAYFDNGYDYDDAVALAKVWNQGKDGDDLSVTKVTAGRKILGGITLPVRP